MNNLGMDIEKITKSLEQYKNYANIQKENLEKMKRTFSSYAENYKSTQNSKNMMDVQEKLIKKYTKMIEQTDLKILEIQKQIENYKNTSIQATNIVNINN